MRCFIPTTATGPSNAEAHGKYDDIGLLKSYYGALRKLSQSVDVVSANAPLEGYKLVVAPSLNVLPKDIASHLLDTCVVRASRARPPFGMKDEFNGLLAQRQPGYLTEALGGRVEQFYALEKNVPISGPGAAEMPAYGLSSWDP